MVRRGEIYLVEWSPGRGSEQTGIRPALVVQNDVGNQNSPTTIVAAVSTQRRKAYPFQVLIGSRDSGLPQDSIVKCEQLQTIDQSRLGRRIGTLSTDRIRQVDIALRRSLAL